MAVDPFLHGPRRVGRPFAPRSRVELRARQARVFEREKIVAGGDARSAVADNPLGGDAAERFLHARAQLLGCSKESPFVEIPLEEVVRRAGNVPGRPVDRLGLAPVAFRRTGVEQTPLGPADERGDLIDIHGHVRARRAMELARLASLRTARRGAPLGLPFREPAVEHGDRVVPEPAQQPPQPARVHAVLLVVRDRLHAARHAETAEGLGKRVRIRQGVAAVRPVSGTGEVAAEGCVDRARDVRRRMLSFSPPLIVELVAAVDDRERRIV